MNASTAHRPSSPVVGLHHVALAVHDIVGASRFYREGAGCQPWPAAHMLELPTGAMPLCSSNAGLVLLPADPAAVPVRRPVSESGIAHLCLQTPDLAGLLKRMRALGAVLHSEPVDLGTGFLYCYARDAEHNVIEIEGVAAVWQHPQAWLAHANVVSHDLPKLVDFYSRWLAATAVRSPRLHSDRRLDSLADLSQVQTRMAWLNAGNAQIELMQYLHPATTAATGRRAAGAPGYVHLAFEVTSLALAREHLLGCGGRLDDAPAAAAVQSWQARGFDADGNRLLLLDLHAPAHQDLRIDALAEPGVNQRVAAARGTVAAIAAPS